MEKDEVIFKIGDCSPDDLTESNLSVCVYYSDHDGYMVDEHVVDELFPELEDLGMLDLCEGEIEYSGSLSKYELSEVLEANGFKTLVFP